MEEGKITKYL